MKASEYYIRKNDPQAIKKGSQHAGNLGSTVTVSMTKDPTKQVFRDTHVSIGEDDDLSFQMPSFSCDVAGAWDQGSAERLIHEGWYQSKEDGLFRNETPEESVTRASRAADIFFKAFEHENAPPVVNVVPAHCRGYVGPGRSLQDLIVLCRLCKPCRPYQIPGNELPSQGSIRSTTIVSATAVEWRPDQEFQGAVSFEEREKLLSRRPRAARLSSGEHLLESDRKFEGSAHEGYQLYRLVAQKIANNAIRRIPPDIISSQLFGSATACIVGPGGSGKTYIIETLVKSLMTVSDCEVYILYYFDRNCRSNGIEYISLENMKDRRIFAGEPSEGDSWKLLIVDEISDITASDLSRFGNFDQVLFFGDYSQASSRTMPVFDFVMTCGGKILENNHIWRSSQNKIFDLVSELAYDGRYAAYPTPDEVLNDGEFCFTASSCEDNATSEIIAMFIAAQRNLQVGFSVCIVVDDFSDGQDAVKFVENKIVNQGLNKLSVRSLSKLKGVECQILIVATGMLDRMNLPISRLVSYLILILGRAKKQVQFVFPKAKEVVTAGKRRFSCMAQPILSYRLIGEKTTKYEKLIFALRQKGLTTKALRDSIAVWNKAGEAFMICPRLDSDLCKLLVYKLWTPIELECGLEHMPSDGLEQSEAFHNLLKIVSSPKS